HGIEQVAEVGELHGLERQPGSGALPRPHDVVAIPLEAEADRRKNVIAVARRAGGRLTVAERPGGQRPGRRTVGALGQARRGYEAMELDQRRLLPRRGLVGLAGRGSAWHGRSPGASGPKPRWTGQRTAWSNPSGALVDLSLWRRA